jgi:magnesium transporter
MASNQHKKKKKPISKKGLPPGTRIYIGEDRNHPIIIEITSYNSESIVSLKNVELSKLKDLNPSLNHWINVNGIYDTSTVITICDHFNIDPLTVEDLLNTNQRPKSDDFGNYIFFTLKMLDTISSDDLHINLDDEQISFLLGRNFVVSFQEKPGDVFDPIRKRFENPESRVRKFGSDFLVYALVDVIIDDYFETVDKISTIVEVFDNEIAQNPQYKQLETIQHFKFLLLNLRRYIYPTREAVHKLARIDNPIIDTITAKYYNDLIDHIYQILENLEIVRDMNSNQREMYASSLSLRMNRVMEVLTIISSLFIPLTFIVGVYGMNFKYMPELSHEYGYFFVWISMILVTLGMLYFFRRKGWI